MGIAFFTFNSLFAPLQQFAQWFMGENSRKVSQPAPLQRTAELRVREAAKAPVRTPLRVVRVMDSGMRTCAGRMVISGRMADVCAELDRLAALEAASC